MTTNDLVILIPVLQRPHRVKPLLDSIAASTSCCYRVLFLCTADDHDQIAAVHASGCDYLICGPRLPGDYARKINLGYNSTTEPLIFLGADDLLFHDGWFDAARSYLSDQIHVVGTNDLGNVRVMAGKHSTHTLLTRAYADTYGTIDRHGMILHPAYPHTFCDDEFVQTAISRKMFAHAPDAIVEHLHPNWNKAEWDEVYSLADQSLGPGRRLFNQRRRMWMPIKDRRRGVGR